MDNHRDMQAAGRKNHGDGYKAAFGKDDVGAVIFQDLFGFTVAFQHAERVGEVLQIKIAAQLSRRNSIVGDAGLLDQPLLNAGIGADITDFITCVPQRGD